MIADHAVYRDLQRYRYEDRDGDRKYAKKKDPDQMGMARPSQLKEAFQEDSGMRSIGQCR